MSAERQHQVETNFQAFQEMLPDLMDQAGRFALMRNEHIVALFDTAGDALVAAEKLYPDSLFSIQEVTKTPIDLGFFSHAVP
jgi:hypothetical protein